MVFVIAGERSGVGKTTVTLALLASLCRQGKRVQSFKVGPDYIDPMFHQYVTGLPCRNLDPVLTSESYIQECFAQHFQKADCAVVEGVMGLFDGINLNIGDTSQNIPNYFGSTAHIARLLNLPVILVMDCSRLSGSAAAIALGYSTLDPRINIAGLVLNRVGSSRHLELLKTSLEPLNLPILGVLQRENDITIPDRHLGLIPTDELPELDAVISKLADLGDSCFNWELLKEGRRQEAEGRSQQNTSISPNSDQNLPSKTRIAVARDRAFNFYYQDNLDLLQKLGAELVFWSPLNNQDLPPNIQGMYFGGGFPEMFAEELSKNTSVLTAIKSAILSGMPTIAECGGLMYLCDKVIDFTDTAYPMVGVLPTTAIMDQRLTLGYRQATTLGNSFLFDAETTVYGHEFHRSRLISHPEPALFHTSRVDTEEFTGNEGYNLLPNLHASYIHLHWGATPQIPQVFMESCLNWH
ncbi:cobyrinate a,c-diamide synthase [Calothrix sp. PCC 6303]|uniref:cobyrinate a,c-diamide synthase n=1 Tax=Calothrix sp. PCC 6303 TaxID=1170562 RepID=UPI0002A02F8F|nr:cobyrinate a,c-diamide synthase [Calothrix sp. PCC 6303]AFZ00824.1 hydrogenobyrinic acid a,c-diamide synthase (glutamine-hydrolysing) [Calothrix sp. PCC 6303]